jgi:Fe-S cluster biogenesis protein NfuA
MGKTFDSMGQSGGPSGDRELRITEAARTEIRRRLAEAEQELVFFVLTQPSPLGFNVGVGFEARDSGSGREVRSAFDPPLAVSDQDLERLAGHTIDFRDGRFVTVTDVSVYVSPTPNPDSRKFIVNRELISEGSATFRRPPKETDPPLVRVLLALPQVRALFFIKRFCTVTRETEAPWEDLQNAVGKRLQGYFAHGGVAMPPPPRDDRRFGEVEKKIIAVLEDVIRPAVQRDGGDIAFAGYDAGRVQVYMLGSCAGCPSAAATLQMGVQSLLKEAVPEVTEVVALD